MNRISHKAFLPAYLTLYSLTLQISSHFTLVWVLAFCPIHPPFLPPSCALPNSHLHPSNQSISVQLFLDALSGLSWDNVTLLQTLIVDMCCLGALLETMMLSHVCIVVPKIQHEEEWLNIC